MRNTISQKVKNCKSAMDGKSKLFRLEWEATKDEWPFDSTVGMGFWFPQLWHLVEGFALFNPHLTISLDWFVEKRKSWLSTDPKWKKWLPSDPTSPHWYRQAHLERLIGAYVTHERDNDNA